MENISKITNAELPVIEAVELVLNAISRANNSSSNGGHFRVSGGDAAGTIAVKRKPLQAVDVSGWALETHDYMEACVGPEFPASKTVRSHFWEGGTIIGVHYGSQPGLSFTKGKKEWRYGSDKPAKKFVGKALVRLGLNDL